MRGPEAGPAGLQMLTLDGTVVARSVAPEHRLGSGLIGCPLRI